MTLAQVQAVVATIVVLGTTWAGLILAVALMLPVQTSRAENALEMSAKRCLWGGVGMMLVFGLANLLLNNPNPIAKFLGFGLLSILGAMLSIGAAGLAQLMGKRIGEMAGAKTSFGMLVRGSIVYSLAMFFPLLGWFVFAPLSGLCTLGAGAAALWPRRRTEMPPISPNVPLEGRGVA